MKIIVTVVISLLFTTSVFAAESKCSKENAEACYTEGTDLGNNNKYPEALNALSKGCDFGLAKSCRRAGVLEERLKRYPEAKAFYLKACEINKEEPCKNAQKVEAKK